MGTTNAMKTRNAAAYWLRKIADRIEQPPVRSPRDRLAALLWRAMRDNSSGVSRAELLSLVRTHDRGPKGKPMSVPTFYRAWSELDEAGLLGMTGYRYVLSNVEAERLGLPA